MKLALTGKLRSGKDTAADRLFYEHGIRCVAFGDALKRKYHELLPWVAHDPKPRAGYQKFGQVVRQEFGEDVWVRHAEARVAALLDSKSTVGVVITDLRQPNEFEWARENGFVIIRVTAPEAVRLERARKAGDTFEMADLAHDTEQHSDTFSVDYEIVNDEGLTELYEKVDAILAEIKKEAQ